MTSLETKFSISRHATSSISFLGGYSTFTESPAIPKSTVG